MRLVPLLIVTASACAHETRPSPGPNAAKNPYLAVKIEIKDARPDSSGPQLKEALMARVSAQLADLGVPVATDAALTMEIDLISIATKWGQGSPRSCVDLAGRLIRDGQRFTAVDVPSQRCTSDERYAAFKDLQVLADLRDPHSQNRPTPEGQLIIEALDPLVGQLAQRCR